MQPDKASNFVPYDLKRMTLLDESYDYDSVMHYAKDAFTVNGLPTIVPKRAGASIGQRDHLSKLDVRKVALSSLIACDLRGA